VPEQIEEKKDLSVDVEGTEGKEVVDKRGVKKPQNVLARSDSTGSGRKFLAPTLSDPQARANKERLTDGKRKSIKQNIKTQHLPNLTEVTHHPHNGANHGHHMEQPVTNHNVNLAFEVHDWFTEQIIFQESSDEE
jgi:sodium leak channel non-selective protein